MKQHQEETTNPLAVGSLGQQQEPELAPSGIVALDTRTERERRIHAIAGRALSGDHDRRSLLAALYAIVAEVGDQPFPRRR